MSGYFGLLGRLQPVYSTPGMSVSGGPSKSFSTTLEGRVKAQVHHIGRREWSLTGRAADARDSAALLSFAQGEWGMGPFVWVSPTAPVLNLMSPEQSTCDKSAIFNASVTVGGPMVLPDGSVAGRSFLNSDTASLMYFGSTPVPVIQGRKVTASAYLSGVGCKVRIIWWDAAGALISSVDSVAGGVPVSRLSVTATPPSNAAYCLVAGVSTSQGCRPQVTWTDTLFDWHPGEGCPKAVLTSLDQEQAWASYQVGGRRDAELSYVITEVG